MPMFGIFYIPEADSPLYQIASNIMGYDVRAGQLLPEVNAHRNTFDRFNPTWVSEAQEFGFHATIGHAINFDSSRLGLIEAGIESVLNLFDPQKAFLLTPTDEFLDASDLNLTFYYHANQPFMMFHAMIVALLHPLGYSTPFSIEHDSGLHPDMATFHQHRLQMYYQHWILDDWFPHLRILGHITDDDPKRIRPQILKVMPEPEVLTVNSLCLVIKEDNETHFKLHREFMREDYPKQP